MISKIIKKIKEITGIRNIVLNVNKTNYEKKCLISYITDPFVEGPHYAHQNEIQIIEIARLVGTLGYNVDVIDYRSRHVLFKSKYDALFEVCVREKPVYRKALKDNAVRIAYLTGCESIFANKAEQERIENLRSRRGVELTLRRQAPLISDEIERFDSVIMIGNDITLSTYEKFNINKTNLVPNTGYDFGFKFDQKIKNPYSFLFFGSTGAVHKGLDLLLEVFSELGNPYTLYVCGSYESEMDFVHEYSKELNCMDNIKSVGFVDIMSTKFKELCAECVFSILPSCSEGCAGAVATCMSGGVIPICSRVCGYDDDEVIVLNDCRKETIKETIKHVVKMDINELTKRSNQSIELIRNKYCMEEFSRLMENALKDVLAYE